MRGWILQTLTPLAGASGLLAATIFLGNRAEQSLQAGSSCQTPFAAGECDPPAALSREEFLREVQYEADLPDDVNRLDEGLMLRLRTAFARHPWVESVSRVEIRPTGGFAVSLAFHEPVLAVQGPERMYAVSRGGVLLPRSALSSELPVLRDAELRPTRPTGQLSGAANVEAAARVAGLLQPHRDRVVVVALQFAGSDLVLWTANGSRILWGRPPEHEASGEPDAIAKRDRLLASLANDDSARPVEIDLRAAAGPSCRQLVAADSR